MIAPKHAPDFGRMDRVLRRQGEPDRIPFYEHLADAEIMEAITDLPIARYDQSTSEGKEQYVKGLIRFYYELGFDNVPFEVGPLLPDRRTLLGQDTALLPHARRGWQDEHCGPVQTVEDLERYPWPRPDSACDYGFFEMVARNLPDGMKIIGGAAGGVFEHVSWLMGLEPLSLAMYDDPKLAEGLFERVGTLLLEINRRLLQIGGIGALRMGDDMGFKTSTMLSADQIRQHVLPWQQRIVELAHEHGVPFVLHSCGNLEGIMDDLIDWVGIDAKHSFEDVIMPAAEAKRRYGGRIAILGGVDVDYLSRHSVDEVRAYTRKMIEECAPGGGWALGTGNSVPNYVPVENYLAMLDEGRKTW